MSNKFPYGSNRARISKSLQPLLRHGLKGCEKEGLRITQEGTISPTTHPVELGAALTHPHITTDYSEALLELITPALSDGGEMLGFLTDLHKYVCANIKNELLLAVSMPIGDLGNSAIPIANYGTSNIGQMKHIYRQGLSYRYGRCMQVIAGIHFNYSLPESFWPEYQHFMKQVGNLQSFRTDAYMGMIRNLQRYGWLIHYLFGSSPAVSKSFVNSRNSYYSKALVKFDETSYYKPFATSLRMSEIGYVNPVQASFHVSFNSLDNYISDLSRATSMSYPDYEKIGIRVDGQYRQLNTNLLQIENEYYTSVRPKQPTMPNERPLRALRSRGIEYIEIRSLDIDIFEPIGISVQTTRFLEALSLLCLFQESPRHDRQQYEEINRNALAVANSGRDPALKLVDEGKEISLRDWALKLAEQMREICDALDEGDEEKPYAKALLKQIEVIRQPELTSSARMLATMRDQKLSVLDLALQKSREHTAHFQQAPLDALVKRDFDLKVQNSLEVLERLNNAPQIPFDQFLQNYFSCRAKAGQMSPNKSQNAQCSVATAGSGVTRG